MIPIYGTYKAGQRFFKNPSWRGAGEFAISALGDAAMLTGAGAGIGMALKAGNMASKAGKVAKTASALRKVNTARDLKYGQSAVRGGSYYDNAARIADDLANTAAYTGGDIDKALSIGDKIKDQAWWADRAVDTYGNAKWAVNSGVGIGVSSKYPITANK